MKKETYNLKLTKDELEVLGLCLYEYYCLLTDKHDDEDVSMQDEYWLVRNKIRNMVSKINESDKGL